MAKTTGRLTTKPGAKAKPQTKTKARTKTVAYDVAEQLRTPEEMVAYLDAWFVEAPDDAVGIARALGDTARAPVNDSQRLLKHSDDEVLRRFDEVRARIRERTAGFSEEEIAADVAAARVELPG